MTAVLQQWCNDTLGLSKAVGTLEDDFATGYMFAEILHKHNQLDAAQLATLKDNDIASTILHNYAVLEPVLSRIGIKLNARTVTALINKQPQVAQRILYALKTKLAVFERVVVGRPKSTGGKALAKLEPRVPKPSYEILSNQIFDKVLRRLGGNQKYKDQEAKLTVFQHDRLQNYFDEVHAYESAVEGESTLSDVDRSYAGLNQRGAAPHPWGAAYQHSLPSIHSLLCVIVHPFNCSFSARVLLPSAAAAARPTGSADAERQGSDGGRRTRMGQEPNRPPRKRAPAPVPDCAAGGGAYAAC